MSPGSGPGSERDEPLVSFVTPVFCPPAHAFERLAKSVFAQTDPSWQWIIVDDASNDVELSTAIAKLTAAETRVISVALDHNSGIAQATNRGLEQATGRFVAFVDHDDTISPSVVGAIRRIATQIPNADLIYTDETYLGADAEEVILDRDFEFRKPAWSPERLRAQNYLNHLTVVRHSLANSVGGIRTGFDGAQDHDFVLRISEQARQVVHIPEALYQWREAPNSVLASRDNKPAAWDAGRRAVVDHLERIGIDADIGPLSIPGVGEWYGVHPRLSHTPPIALVVGVLTRAEVGPAAISVCTAWEHADYSSLRTVIVAADDDIAAHLRRVLHFEMLRRGLQGEYDLRVTSDGTTRQRLLNDGATQTDAEAFVFVEPGTQLHTAGWVRLLAGVALQPGTGAVGARCMRTPEEIDSSGAVLYKGLPRPLLRGYGPRATQYGSMALVAGERAAVTSQCIAVSASHFNVVGGFSETYERHYYGIDLCLRLRSRGWQIICQAQVDAWVATEHFPLGWHDDIYRLRERWGTMLDVDPYLNVKDQETVR